MNQLSLAATCGVAIISLFASTSSPASASTATGIAGVGPGPQSRLTPRGEKYQLVHQGHDHIHGIGTVNSLDEAKHTVNLSHGPIPQVGWPAMTLDFGVSPSVDLKAIKSGAKVEFTLERSADGTYEIDSLKPVAEGR